MADFVVSVKLKADGSGLVGQLNSATVSLDKVDAATRRAGGGAKVLDQQTKGAASSAAAAAASQQRVAQATMSLSTSFTHAGKSAGTMGAATRGAAGGVDALAATEGRLAAALRANLASLEANTRALATHGGEGRRAAAGVRDLDRAAASTASGGLGSLRAALAGLGLGALTRDIVTTAREFRGQEQAFTRIRGSASAAAGDIAFLQATADRLGVSFRGMTQQSVGLAAGLQRIPNGQQIFRDLTEGVIGLGVAFGRSDYQISNAMRAIEQVANKGRVSLEEITGQLGEAIPDAVGLSARAMGLLPGEFIKAVEAGSVLSDEFLPKLAAQLKKELPEGLESAGADFARFTNELDRAKVAIAEGGLFEGLADGAGDLSAAFREMAESGALREIGQNLGTIIRFVAEHIDLVPTLVGAWVGYKGATLAAAAAQNVLNGALIRNPIGIVAAALGGLVVAYNATDDATVRLARSTEEAKRLNDEFAKSSDRSRIATLADANARLAAASATYQKIKADRESAKAELERRKGVQEFTGPLSFLGGVPGRVLVQKFNKGRTQEIEQQIAAADKELAQLDGTIRELQLSGQELINLSLAGAFTNVAGAAGTAAGATGEVSAELQGLRSAFGGVSEAVREYNVAVEAIRKQRKDGAISAVEEKNLLAGARARLQAAKALTAETAREARAAETEADKLGAALGRIGQDFDAEPRFLDKIEDALKRIAEARKRLGKDGTVTLGGTTFTEKGLDDLEKNVVKSQSKIIDDDTAAMRDQLAVGRLILQGREAEAEVLDAQLGILRRYNIENGQIPPALAEALKRHEAITLELRRQRQEQAAVDASRTARQDAEIIREAIAGREDEAEVLRRVYAEVDDINELGEGRLEQIRAEVRLSHDLNRAYDLQRQKIGQMVDVAGDLQRSMRDVIRSALDLDFGGVKDAIKGIGGRFKDAIADQISTALFGDFAGDIETLLTRQSSPMQKAAGDMSDAATAHVRAARAIQQAAATLGNGAEPAPLDAGATPAASLGTLGGLIGGRTGGQAGGLLGGLLGLTGLVGSDKNKGVTQATDDFINAAASIEKASGKQLDVLGQMDAENIVRARQGDPRAVFNIAGGRIGDAIDQAAGTGQAFGQLGRQAGEIIGTAIESAEFGKAMTDVLGVRGSRTGAAIGGTIGKAVGGPLGEAIGATLGSFVGGLFKSTKKGVATLGLDASGDAAVTGVRGNSKKREDAAAELGGGIVDGLKQIADQLGGTLGAFAVSVGIRKDNFRVDPTGQGRTKGPGVLDFGKDGEAAAAAAVRDAILDGAVQGLSEAVRKALTSSPDLNKALAEAQKVRDVEDFISAGSMGGAYREFAEFEKAAKDRAATAAKYGLDLVRLEAIHGEQRADMWRQLIGDMTGDGAAEIRQFERTAAERVRIATDFGFDLVEMERVNAEQRAQVFDDAMRAAVGGLMDLKDSFKFGDMFEGDAQQRRAALQTEIDKLKPLAEGGNAAAADRLAQLLAEQVRRSRESFGTAGAEFAADRNQAQTIADQIIAQTEARLKAAQEAAQAGADAGAGVAPDLAPTNALLDENNAQNAEALALARRSAEGIDALNGQMAGLLGRQLVEQITNAVQLV